MSGESGLPITRRPQQDNRSTIGSPRSAVPPFFFSQRSTRIWSLSGLYGTNRTFCAFRSSASVGTFDRTVERMLAIPEIFPAVYLYYAFPKRSVNRSGHSIFPQPFVTRNSTLVSLFGLSLMSVTTCPAIEVG